MIFAPGTISQSVDVQIVDDSGLPVTGLVAATFPAVSYSKGNNTAASSITLSDLAAITTAYTSGGVKERSGGYYRLDLPNAALSTAAVVTLIGEATNKRLICPRIDVANVPANALQWNSGALPAIPTATENSAALLGTAIDSVLVQTMLQGSYKSLGLWTGTGVNTVLGALRALMNKAAGVAVPSDISSGGGTFDNTTDSAEAIRDRGDAAWVTGAASSQAITVEIEDTSSESD